MLLHFRLYRSEIETLHCVDPRIHKCRYDPHVYTSAFAFQCSFLFIIYDSFTHVRKKAWAYTSTPIPIVTSLTSPAYAQSAPHRAHTIYTSMCVCAFGHTCMHNRNGLPGVLGRKCERWVSLHASENGVRNQTTVECEQAGTRSCHIWWESDIIYNKDIIYKYKIRFQYLQEFLMHFYHSSTGAIWTKHDHHVLQLDLRMIQRSSCAPVEQRTSDCTHKRSSQSQM